MTVRMMAGVMVAVLWMAGAACGENWPQWRGPSFDGSSPDKGAPTQWSPTENVTWVTPLPGKGGSTPIVWDNLIFVTACEEPSLTLWALCLNRENGQILWKAEAGKSFDPGRVRGNTASSPSPVTDGERVVFYFGTGRLMGFKASGEALWDRDITQKYGPFQIKFGYSNSPLLHKGRLYIPVMHGWRPDESVQTPLPDSYLLCVDLATGEDLWRHVRNTSAPAESRDSYASPHLFQTRNGPQIIMNGGDYITAHDPETGEEIWRSDNYNKKNNDLFRTICSTTSLAGILFAPESRGSALFAIREGGSGQLQEADRVWTAKEYGSDVCVPLVCDKKLFVLDGQRRMMTCRDPYTGTLLSKRIMTGYFYASPTGADGKIYCINLDGECTVFSADQELKELFRVSMGEKTSGSTLSISEGQLFIRTDSKLYCIGPRKK